MPPKKAPAESNWQNITQNWLTGVRSVRLRGTLGGPPLEAHQQRVVNHMNTHNRMLAIHGTGSGKTLMSVHVAEHYLNKDPSKNIVIFVTPAAVQSQFKRTAELRLSGRPGVYFTTYDGLTNFLNRLYTSRHATVRSIVKHALIIADEAHYITEKTEKARVFYEIFKSADKVLLMTGTPIQNGELADLRPYAQILNPDVQVPQVFDPTKYFKCKVSIYSVSNTNSRFPTLRPTQRVNIPLSQNQSNAIKSTRAGRYNWSRVIGQISSSGNNSAALKGRSGWAFNRNIYAKQVFPNLYSEPKFQKFYEIYRRRPYKTIVYFQQYVSMDRFKDFLKSRHIHFQEISGRANKTNKTGINNPHNKTVYLLTKAAKEGLDFKGVRTVIFMDYPWVPSNYNQIVGRARRFQSHVNLNASNRNVMVYELAYTQQNPKTLNVRSLNILNTKRTKIAHLMSQLRSVSIEVLKGRCGASPVRAKTPSPTNRTKPRPNRTIVRNQPSGIFVAVSPGGTKYHLANLNKPITAAIVPPRTKRNYEGFANIGAHRRKK